LAHANAAFANANVFAVSRLRGFRARRSAAWFAYANLLILWDVHFVCALFETVVASQVSPPVGEQGKQDFTWRPSAERLPVKQDGPAWGRT